MQALCMILLIHDAVSFFIVSISMSMLWHGTSFIRIYFLMMHMSYWPASFCRRLIDMSGSWWCKRCVWFCYSMVLYRFVCPCPCCDMVRRSTFIMSLRLFLKRGDLLKNTIDIEHDMVKIIMVITSYRPKYGPIVIDVSFFKCVTWLWSESEYMYSTKSRY